MVTVMGFPDTWNFTVQGLISIVKEGREAVYSAIKELRKAGYITVEQIRDEHGKLGETVYTFREVPVTDLPHTENPYTANPQQLIKQGIKETKNTRRSVSETLTNTPTTDQPAVAIVRKYFPSVPLSPSWSAKLNSAVRDFDVWERTVLGWMLNGYKPGRKMLEYYNEEMSGDPYAHFNAFSDHKNNS